LTSTLLEDNTMGVFDNIGSYGSITDMGRSPEVRETRREERISIADVNEERHQTTLLSAMNDRMARDDSVRSYNRYWGALSAHARRETMDAEFTLFTLLCYGVGTAVAAHLLSASWGACLGYGLLVVIALRAVRRSFIHNIHAVLSGAGALLACVTGGTVLATILAGVTMLLASSQSRPPMITFPAAAGVGALLGAGVGAMVLLFMLFTPAPSAA
jgi:hypothetical protein